MLQRRLPQSSPPPQPLWALPPRRRQPLPQRFWPHAVGAVVLVTLSLVWTARGVAGTKQAGFTQDCSGFAQDPLLGSLWPGTPERGVEQHATTLAAMVPRLSLRGTALATYKSQWAAQTAPTLETVFGISHGAQREIVETPFAQDARAVVLSPHVLATVAHALTPEVVEVQVAQQASVQTVPLRVISTMMLVWTAPDAEGVPAQVAHINTPYDLALVQAEANRVLQPLPYQAVLSYGTGDPEKPTGGLQAGDCVAAVVTRHTDKGHNTGQDRLVVGKVLTKVPVATNSLTQTKLNVNMFTTDLAVQPGDSGAPVLALQGGTPVLVGLVSATMYPAATFTYVSRIDPLLALADALRLAPPHPAPPLLVQSPNPPSLPTSLGQQ